MATESKLSEIVEQLVIDMKKQRQDHEASLSASDERVKKMVNEVEDKIKGIVERVEKLEQGQASLAKKSDIVVRALHAVESKTSDSSYISQFVEQQMAQMKKDLKDEVTRTLNAQHEKAVTSLEVNRHIDHSRLDGKCAQLGERLSKLEDAVLTEQQNTVQVIEALLSSQKQ